MTSMRKFIRENRKEIDKIILEANPNQYYFNDAERESWIQNHEGLYNWARSCGVNV